MFKHGFPPEWSTLKKLIWLVGSGIAGAASAIWKTVTGTLIHITDALASPVQALSVAIEPQQSGSGDPSPTNIRPIQGWTGCNINVSGADTSNPTVCPISWQTEAGTVYGGTLDVVSGALTSKLKAMHFSDLTWSENANFTDIFNGDGFIDRKRRIDGSNANGCYCDSYQWAKSDKLDTTTNGIALGNTTSAQTRTRIYVKDPRFSSPQEFVASFATYDPLVICPLATEDEYSLTPTTVNTLQGENNIWADVNGEITLIYKAQAE